MLTPVKTHGKLEEMQKSWLVQNEQEMMLIGRCLGERARRGDLFFLCGDLGSGKTTLTKGLASGLGVTDVVASPTFQIVKGYQGRVPLFHLDLYRLKNAAELEILEPDQLTEDGVVVVEWGRLWLEALRPAAYLEIQLTAGTEATGRQVTFIPHGADYQRFIEDMQHVYLGN